LLLEDELEEDDWDELLLLSVFELLLSLFELLFAEEFSFPELLVLYELLFVFVLFSLLTVFVLLSLLTLVELAFEF
jgi:hypothetical protein